MTIQQLAQMILTSCNSSEGTDVTLAKTGHLLAMLIEEIETQAQHQPGYHTGWMEIVSDYIADRVNDR